MLHITRTPYTSDLNKPIIKIQTKILIIIMAETYIYMYSSVRNTPTKIIILLFIITTLIIYINMRQSEKK